MVPTIGVNPVESLTEVAVSFLASPAFQNIVLAVLGTAVTAVTAWVQKQKFAKESDQKIIQKAYSELEASVHSKYERAEQLKQQDGGKLSPESQKVLRDEIVADLTEIASETGFDVVEAIGPRLIGPAITHVVRRLKGKVAPPDATMLPNGVLGMFPDVAAPEAGQTN
jgi:hypothetical protein